MKRHDSIVLKLHNTSKYLKYYIIYVKIVVFLILYICEYIISRTLAIHLRFDFIISEILQ